MKNIAKKMIIMATLATVSLSAAEQGSLVYGDKSINSNGNLNITLKIANAIQINQLNDINLGTFKSGTDSDKSGSDLFCVFSNSESFSLTVMGQNNDGFKLKAENNSNWAIPYEVSISTVNLSGVRAGYNVVGNNSTLTNIREVRKNKSCLGVSPGVISFHPNLEIKIKVKEYDMLDSIPASYKDTITMIASPE